MPPRPPPHLWWSASAGWPNVRCGMIAVGGHQRCIRDATHATSCITSCVTYTAADHRSAPSAASMRFLRSSVVPGFLVICGGGGGGGSVGGGGGGAGGVGGVAVSVSVAVALMVVPMPVGWWIGGWGWRASWSSAVHEGYFPWTFAARYLHRRSAVLGALPGRVCARPIDQKAHRVGVARFAPPARPVKRRESVAVHIVDHVDTMHVEHLHYLRPPLEAGTVRRRVAVLLRYRHVRAPLQQQLDQRRLAREHRGHERRLPSGWMPEVDVGAGIYLRSGIVGTAHDRIVADAVLEGGGEGRHSVGLVRRRGVVCEAMEWPDDNDWRHCVRLPTSLIVAGFVSSEAFPAAAAAVAAGTPLVAATKTTRSASFRKKAMAGDMPDPTDLTTDVMAQRILL